MALPTNRQELIDYCLRRLGAPVIEINLDPGQIEDRVDDAFLYFQDYHFDGVERVYLAHQMTAQDITNEYIPIPAPIISVTRVLPTANSNASNIGLFDVQYQMRLNDLYTFTSTSIIHYDIMQKHLALLEFEFNADPGILFVRHQMQLRILLDWSSVSVGDYYIIECYRILDPDVYPDVYRDRWLMAYTTELLRRQWGENLIKYQGVALLGGVTLNGADIYQKALDNIEKLEQQVHDEFQLPIDFIMG
jgi:hypothetical protein